MAFWRWRQEVPEFRSGTGAIAFFPAVPAVRLSFWRIYGGPADSSVKSRAHGRPRFKERNEFLMEHVRIIGSELPNIPWQNPPEGRRSTPLWRWAENPIIGRNPISGVARVFNSAVMLYKGEFIGVFRGEQVNGIPYIYLGRSGDAVHWEFESEKIAFVDEEGRPFMPRYAYDPRLVRVEDTYYIMWCQDFYGASIGIAKTKDFKTFVRLENPYLPFNRNAVLFPRKINGNFVMLSRPSDSGHTPFGDIFLSESPDMEFWGRHRHVMGRGSEWWESLKIGGGAAPIETSEGWLLFYHGVSGTCNGYVYSIGGAILDIDHPSVVKYRCQNYLLTPEEWYEERGFVPNVTFPCATLCDAETGRIAVYYGAADSYVGLAFTTVQEVVDYIKANSVLTPEDTEPGRR
jgi:Predicted glycosylase